MKAEMMTEPWEQHGLINQRISKTSSTAQWCYELWFRKQPRGLEVRKSERQKQLDKPAHSSPSPTQLDTACSTFLKIGGREKAVTLDLAYFPTCPLISKQMAKKRKKKKESGLEGGACAKLLNNRVESFRWKRQRRVWWPEKTGVAVILKQMRALSLYIQRCSLLLDTGICHWGEQAGNKELSGKCCLAQTCIDLCALAPIIQACLGDSRGKRWKYKSKMFSERR